MDKYCEIKENAKLRNKLLCMGISGPAGPRGEIGPTGPTGPTSSASIEALFSTSLADSSTSNLMTFDNPWFIPNDTDAFYQVDDSKISVTPGIYEISMSGLISGVDENHGAEVYLSDDNGSAIKDLNFKLLSGNINQMYFSQIILFRFDKETILEVTTNFTGDTNSSNVVISGVNVFIKKIKE